MIACRTSVTKLAIVDFVDLGRSMNFSGLVGHLIDGPRPED